MQSMKLSYARYMFFKERNINIDETNSERLFIIQKLFEKKYGITKQELLERYPYMEGQEQGDQPKAKDLEKEALINKIMEQQKHIKEQEKTIKELKNKENEQEKQ